MTETDLPSFVIAFSSVLHLVNFSTNYTFAQGTEVPRSGLLASLLLPSLAFQSFTTKLQTPAPRCHPCVKELESINPFLNEHLLIASQLTAVCPPPRP